MRAAILFLAVLSLGYLAADTVTRDLKPWTPQGADSSPPPPRLAQEPSSTLPGLAQQPSSSRPPFAQEPPSPRPPLAQEPPSPRPPPAQEPPSPRPPQSRQRAGAQSPDRLELVALPASPGAPPPPPRSITRAEAVASVIGSREFQETLSPLARLYLATFGRYPDYEGINYYAGQREEARPLDSIADEFVGSREFQMRYGDLDDAAFVELLFTNVLGNAAQADVRGYWVEALESGRMTRGQVLLDLAESGAFRERSAHQVFVSTAYTEILRRTPDPAGYEYWLGQLRAGKPHRSVIDGLLASR